MAVVADQDDSAFIVVERLNQRLARVDVEVVGRLVEDQQVRRVAGDQRQRQPRALAARKLGDVGGGAIARKPEAAELGPDRAGRLAGHGPGHMLERGAVGGELLDLVLGEIADAHLARGLHLAFSGGELRGEQARERGLAVAIAAEQRHPVVGIDAQVEPAQHRLAAIADRGEVERD